MRIFSTILISIGFTLIFAGIKPSVAHAASPPPVTCKTLYENKSISKDFYDNLCKDDSRNAIEVVVENIANLLVDIFTVFASLFIVTGAIQISASGGVPSVISAGKKKIALSIGGLAVLLSGRLFMDLIGVTGSNRFLGVPVDNFGFGTITEILAAIGTYLIFFAGAASVAGIIIGGIRLMASQGNPQSIASAKKAITYAIIGLVVAILLGNLSYLMNFVKYLLTA